MVRLPFSIAIAHFVSEGLGGAIDHESADVGRRERAAHRITMAVKMILLCGSVDAILDFFNYHLFVVSQQKIIRSLKLNLFSSMMRQELAFFDSEPTGNLMSRLTADTTEMSGDISWVFRFSIEAVVRIVGVAGYMFFCSWRLALLACTLIPANAMLNRRYAAWLHDNAKKSQSALADSNSVAQEVLSGVRTVKAYAKENFEFARYAQSVQRYYELSVLQGAVQGSYYMCVSTFLMNCIVQAGLVGYGAFLTWHGTMSVDSLIAFLLYQGQLQEWVNNLLNSYTQLLRGAGAAARVFALLDRVPRLRLGDKACASPTQGHVQYLDVVFVYASRPEAPVLRKFSLDALPGQCVALVGGSGAGKSTLFNLLVHFYESTSGTVLLDGRDVCELDHRELCSRVSLVSQEPILFRGSVEDNIRYSQSQPDGSNRVDRWGRWWSIWNGTDELAASTERASKGPLDFRVEEAARIANAYDFIMALPCGFRTEVGERGVQLSGGQRQRIAIGRAVMQDPRVLLLDEATSALDSESERIVQEALDRASMQRTTLVIAHRLSTITGADLIVVMEKGAEVERGSHKGLLEAGGRYYELWQRQRDEPS